MAKKATIKKEDVLNLDNILFKCHDILRQAKNSGSFFEKRDIVLIVCGSATSWISKKLLKDKGGLRGRLTNRIKLVPFTLRECELFAKSANLAFGGKTYWNST